MNDLPEVRMFREPVRLEDIVKIQHDGSPCINLDFSKFGRNAADVWIAYFAYTGAVNTGNKIEAEQAALQFETLTGFSARDVYTLVLKKYAALMQQTHLPLA